LRKTTKTLAGLALAGPLALASTGANAVPVDLELLLLADVSASVSSAEYDLQKQGYVDAFESTALQNAIFAGPNGSAAVAYAEWSGAFQQSLQVGWTLINDATSSNDFADAIDGTNRAFSGSTAPGSAINWAMSEAAVFGTDNGYEGTRLVIDVSGDGSRNSGDDTSDARDAALGGDIDAINGIVIGGGAPVEDFYQNNVVGGTNSFLTTATDFSDFGDAVEDKLIREVTDVPEPSVLSILGIGLAGLGFVRRRRPA